ncbi:MAG: cell envelope integrity protein TolA [Gammaproteobacteria bacterium]|nr:cell envelope integrity protein TolA [Gammaproteobacteria bacterium]
MWQLVKEHPRSFAYAVLAHLLLLIMLVINLDWSPKPTSAGAPTPPVQAVIVDESKVSAEVERLKTEDQRKEQAAAERLRELEEKTKQAEAARVKEQKRLEDVKKKQVVEEKRLKEQETERKLEQQKLTEKKRIAEQKKLEQKQAEQKQQAAAAEQKKQAEEKRLAEAESKRKMAAEAKAKAEVKAKADAEAKAKAEAEAQRKAAEQALQAQIAAEDAARNQSIISQYVGIIGDRVQRNWIQPPSSRAGLSCVVQVQLIPGGDVVSVQIVQSSGDAAFDRSVEAAVFRAAPLPLPSDPGLFESFRTLQFRFTPK